MFPVSDIPFPEPVVNAPSEQALVCAQDAARTTSVTLAAQNSYLQSLHQVSVELFAERDLAELLRQLVERATALLDGSFAELLLVEGDDLVVRATTLNQPFLKRDRLTRDQARLAWQAVDTLQPTVVNDVATCPSRGPRSSSVELHALANVPISVGPNCIGVLAIGRTAPGQPFSAQQCAQAGLFTQLAAVMIENARLQAQAQREIEAIRQANADLKATCEGLQAQNAELDAFTRTVAHDLKTPLTGIVGLAQVLLLDSRAGRPTRPEPTVELIASTAHQAIQIVDAFLLFAKAASTSPQVETLEMSAIVEVIPQQLHGLIEIYAASLVIPERWPVAQGYGPWVATVWMNYVSNAIKYGGPRPTVTLGCDELSGGQVRFWVRDHGVGLDADQQSRLFTPFTRLHPTGAPGYGLGLSITQRIVSRLGGTVGVESAPGEGSTFFFTLPAASARTVGLPAGDTSAVGAEHSG